MSESEAAVETTEQTDSSAQQESQATTETTQDNSQQAQEQNQQQGGDLTADSYNIELEGFDFNEFKGLEENKAFLGKAAELGITNDQLQYLIGEYNNRAAGLLGASADLDTEATIGSLKEVWGDNFDTNVVNAQKALRAAGFTDEDLNKPEIGNNVALAKLAAHFGAQMNEDATPQGAPASNAINIQDLLSNPAYDDVSHPDHNDVVKQVEAYYSKNR